MPRYDYRCESCRTEFELLQSFSEAGNGTCPACSGKGQRVYHAVPVIYKGSGFYTTDYGRPKPPVEGKSSSNSDSPDSTKSTSDSKSSSDSKSETAAKSTSDSSSSSTSDSSSNTPSSTSASST